MEDRVVYRTDTNGPSGSILRLGFERRDRMTSRTAVHVSVWLHEPQVDNPTGETKFLEDMGEIFAVSGDTNAKAALLVKKLAQLVALPLHEQLGIRILESSIPGFDSKVVFFNPDLPRHEIIALFLAALGFDLVEVQNLEAQSPSELEQRDRLDYDLLD